MSLATLHDDLLDLILSALPLEQLLDARASGHLLRARVQRRFLPVVAPPTLAAVAPTGLSLETHQQVLIRLFAEYVRWRRQWSELHRLAHPPGRGHVRRHLEELRQQQSPLDAYFSLAPWWRKYGEVVPATWRPEQWLHDAIYSSSSRPFYQRRLREQQNSFRTFYTTPAEAPWPRYPRTLSVVLAPLNVKMRSEPRASAMSTLPELSVEMLEALGVAARLLRAYVPGLSVTIDPVRTHVLSNDRRHTRADRQGANAADGKRVRQLAVEGVEGVRALIDEAHAEDDEAPFITMVVAAHLFPAEHASEFAWVYSSPLGDATYGLDSWVFSTHQIEAFVEGQTQRRLVLSHLLAYCVLHEALDLEICENVDCVLNNCDSVGEAEELSPYLCPTCMRKLHVMGIIDDAPACHARLRQVVHECF